MKLYLAAIGVPLLLSTACCHNDHAEAPAESTRAVAGAAPTGQDPKTPAAPAVSTAPTAERLAHLPEAVPAKDQPEGHPRRVRIFLDPYTGPTVAPADLPWLYVSEDSLVSLQITPALRGLAVITQPVDTGGSLLAVEIVDDPPCQGERRFCDQRHVEKMVARANAYLGRHRWTQFRSYDMHPLDRDRKGCDGPLSRHFRIEGYEVRFDPPRLRIVREQGGMVILDRDLDWMDEKSPPECRRPAALGLWSLHVDATKRVIAFGVSTCAQESCPSAGWHQYVRLPGGTR